MGPAVHVAGRQADDERTMAGTPSALGGALRQPRLYQAARLDSGKSARPDTVAGHFQTPAAQVRGYLARRGSRGVNVAPHLNRQMGSRRSSATEV